MKTKVSPRTASTSKPAKVNFTREELSNLLPQYYLIRDAIDGEPAIKGLTGTGASGVSGAGNGGFSGLIDNQVLSRAKKYLPQPNAEDQSPSNIERYRSYVTRAVFYGVTGRTLEGMAGQIYLREPIVELPTELELLKEDADGGGLTLDQTSHKAVRLGIAHGRGGMLVDYPITDGPATKQDIADGEIRPTITVYPPWDIINWRVETEGAKRRLTFLVLRETIDEEGEDGFQLNSFEQYRVLRLNPTDGTHSVEIYRQSRDGFAQLKTANPKNSKGKPLTEIPFHFFGSENNEVNPNRPPLYDLAALNIAHYRNSADYEEACFIAGQPTPVLAGLSEDWVKNVLNGVVTLGSRAAIPLPVGATAALLQAQENSMPIEAMHHKEDQMVALGAKLIQNRQTAETATAKIIDTSSESSTLANVSKNVSAVMVWALQIAGDFVGVDVDGIKYALNKDFDLTSMTADDQNAVISQWQDGAISWPELRTVLRRAGTATEDDDAAKKQIAADIKAGLIPDPAMKNKPPAPAAVPGQQKKAPSDAGGPQPKPIRKKAQPGTTG